MSTRIPPELERELLELILANRERALWSLPPDFVPRTKEASRRVLQRIAARGDRATFVRAQNLLRRLT
jgi:hypothetical protein